jgi:hypothetical protein
MRVVVTGGRYFEDGCLLYDTLDELGVTELAHGGATGADHLAQEWADLNSVPTVIFKPDWNGLGKKAGPIRNRQMIKEFMPDCVVAFPGGRGTASCKRFAEDEGIRVMEIEDDIF